MKNSFVNQDSPLLTVMVQCETPEAAINRIRNANGLGADAFGLQVEYLTEEHKNAETYKRLFGEMKGKPCYVTNYRTANNRGKTDDELAQGMITLAKSGATLVDVMGDIFCKHPEEITDDETAIKKQMQLIDELHSHNAEVLMSSHLHKCLPAERILEIAFEQKRRGADVVKIVSRADSMEQQLENLRITNLLKQELGSPFLFLSGGECSLHRRLGIYLGCCMALCVCEYDRFATPAQPLLSVMKTIKNNVDF